MSIKEGQIKCNLKIRARKIIEVSTLYRKGAFSCFVLRLGNLFNNLSALLARIEPNFNKDLAYL